MKGHHFLLIERNAKTQRTFIGAQGMIGESVGKDHFYVTFRGIGPTHHRVLPIESLAPLALFQSMDELIEYGRRLFPEQFPLPPPPAIEHKNVKEVSQDFVDLPRQTRAKSRPELVPTENAKVGD